MPAEKSKNSLPSTSVTTMPRPLLATSGYERVYDGEIYFSSPSSTRLALGPGRAVLILGPMAVMVFLVNVCEVMDFLRGAAICSQPPAVKRMGPRAVALVEAYSLFGTNRRESGGGGN